MDIDRRVALDLKRVIFLSLILITASCATTGTNPEDPWEGFNRKVYGFNKAIDTAIAKPLAKGYKAITPDFVETGVSNVFDNIRDIPNFINNLLQGKGKDSLSDLSRFVINSTLGIAGLWDPASSMGLVKHDEDFGQTLAYWGVPDGPYLMLPILGPSTVRDTSALPVDSQLNPINYIDDRTTKYSLLLMDLIDKRASLLSFEDQLEAAVDEYSFVRDVYLQNRRFKVFDGNIPLDDDFECEEENEEDCDF